MYGWWSDRIRGVSDVCLLDCFHADLCFFALPVRTDTSSGQQANRVLDRLRIDLGRRVFVTCGLLSSIFRSLDCVRACVWTVSAWSITFSLCLLKYFIKYYYFPDVVSSKERDTAREETKSLMKSVLWSTLDFKKIYIYIYFLQESDSVNLRWEEQPCWSRRKDFLITLDRTSRSPP